MHRPSQQRVHGADKRTFSRLGAIESSSSMKIIDGAFFSASSKALRRLLSDSPASLLMISGPAVQQARVLRQTESINQVFHSTYKDSITVNQVKERASLVGNGASDQSLPCTWRSEQEDTSRRLHSNRFKELRVAKRKLHHLLYQCQLFAGASNVVVADRV